MVLSDAQGSEWDVSKVPDMHWKPQRRRTLQSWPGEETDTVHGNPEKDVDTWSSKSATGCRD